MFAHPVPLPEELHLSVRLYYGEIELQAKSRQ
jgi:hypothetical protein